MAEHSVKIFVDSILVEGIQGEAVIDAIERWDRGVATRLRNGERVLTDSRGLEVGAETPVYGGAIFRVTRGR